ncbi:hypothetical protein, partial [Thiohalophilus sp.]|uniref:hypothetical protein n=1 Tax=Thiohalophilus sp. TaxID=3028392 RepID=UPI003976C16B
MSDNKKTSQSGDSISGDSMAMHNNAIRYLRYRLQRLLPLAGVDTIDPNNLDDQALLEQDPLVLVTDALTEIIERHRMTTEELR